MQMKPKKVQHASLPSLLPSDINSKLMAANCNRIENGEGKLLCIT